MKTITQEAEIVNEIHVKHEKKSWQQLITLGTHARVLRQKSQWVLGDLALECTMDYGMEALDKFARDINEDKETLARYRQVSKAWPKELREKYQNEDGEFFLSHRHFMMLAPREDKEEWLEKAHDNEWSTGQLQLELKKTEGKFDNNLAVSRMLFTRGEYEEIINWYRELDSIYPEKLNEYSREVVGKVKKGLEKAKNGT